MSYFVACLYCRSYHLCSFLSKRVEVCCVICRERPEAFSRNLVLLKNSEETVNLGRVDMAE